MARAMWKGVLQLGEEAIPVKLYAAVQERAVRFRMLQQRSRAPIRQRMVDPEAEREVETAEIIKGYETEPGVFVVLDEQELESLEPKPSRDVTVARFVPRTAVPHAWFDRPYYLGPDGEEEAYFALARALAKQDRIGIVSWVMRKKEYAGALLTHGAYLLLITLRHAGEVVPASALPRPAGRKPDEREIAMARQLVAALEAEFDLAAFHDEYRERVEELVRTKAKGGRIELKKFEPKAATDSLGELLKASVKHARERRVA
ncbi:MAG TPA: Ku protein [Longimicrobiales bacterium]|nr:Ku protein [Longimicrobiales bacterium]